MDYISILIGIISLLITIIGIKKQRDTGRVALVRHFNLNIFNNICKNFTDISLQYNGKPIRENVVYFKASLVNNGRVSIESRDGNTRIILELDSCYHWLDVRINRKSDGLKINPLISTNQLEFKFDFLKEGDFFQFESLIEPQTEILEPSVIIDNLKVNYRIVNLKKIEKMSLSYSDEQMINIINDYNSFNSRFLRYVIYFGPFVMLSYLYFNRIGLIAEFSKMTSTEARLFAFILYIAFITALYSYYNLFLNGYFRRFKTYKTCKILIDN